MIKRVTALIIASLLVISLFGCGSNSGDSTIVGIWQSPAASGHSEGFIYELTEDGHILSSFGGFLYVGGLYEISGSKLTLKNYPTYHIETVGDRPVIVINYGNESENSYELSENELRLTDSKGTTVWTRAISVIPTPTPTPTPTPAPVETPTPEPEFEGITVLYDGAPLYYVNEFSQKVGIIDNKYSVRVEPEGFDIDVFIESDNEEIFFIERINIGVSTNEFEVFAVSVGTANLIVTAGDVTERIIVRITE